MKNTRHNGLSLSATFRIFARNNTENMPKELPYIRWKEYVKKNTPADCRIENDIMILKQKEDFRLGPSPSRLDMTMAIIMKKGSARFDINMTEHSVNAPCMVIVMENLIFRTMYLSDDSEFLIILYSGRFTKELFVGHGIYDSVYDSISRNPVMDLTGDEEVFNSYMVLLDNLIKSPLKAFKLEAARHLTLTMFYSYSYRKHNVEQIAPATRQEAIVQQFCKEVKAHHRKEREVAFYASRLCLSPKYMSGIIKKFTGKSALQYIDEYVIIECKALLLSTDMSVQQISDAMNFPSQSVFGKYFKRICGKSPREFRKKT